MTVSTSEKERWEQGLLNGFFFKNDTVARFALTGADRVRYLNGQCSNDVRKLTPTSNPIQACILSARGKLDAVVWIWAEPERLIVECEACLAESIAARLERYIVADDVTLEPLPAPTDEWHVILGTEGISAEIESSRLRSIHRLGAKGIDVSSAAFCESAGLVQINESMHALLRVLNVVPAWNHELGPDTLPAEAGLDKTAVDFHKGCYLGQEVVSRIESVGHANRALRQFEVTQGASPKTGDLFLRAASGEKPCAEVTTVVEHFGLSKTVGLCYTRRGVEIGDTLIAADGLAQITISEPAA